MLGESAGGGMRVRTVGGGTKLGWGFPVPEPDLEISTAALDRIVEHNEGDLTAVLEAGVPLARAQEAFAAQGQMLALDPPLGADECATVGGVFASGDSGPLRHRYGPPRDVIIGVTMALADGSLARAGGRVIKNVAGYDLAKLACASFGTLGALVQVAVRLHPLPSGTATATVAADDPAVLAGAAQALSHARLQAESLDVSWSAGQGEVLARFAGRSAEAQAEQALTILGQPGRIEHDDEPLWSAQRAAQRADEGGVLLRVSGLQTQLESVLRAADALGASMVGRAGQGLSYLALPAPDAEAVAKLRRELEPSPCVVLDAPEELRGRLDPWGVPEGAELDLMRRVKHAFDPRGACNPGLYVGGI